MKRFTKSLMALALLIGGTTTASASYEIQLGTKYTSVASLSGKVFAIADETAGKAFYGPTGGYGHEVGFGVYSTAFTNDVNYYYFKLVDIPAAKIEADPTLEGYTLIRACKADGSFYTFWGDSGNGYLNTNNDICFLLGITAKNLGQDFEYGAVWKVTYVDGKGFTIQNKYTGDKYLKDAGAPKNDAPTYFTFAEVESVEVYDPDTSDPGVADIPAGSVSLIKNGTLEGTDVSSFFTKVNKGGANPSTITAGVGRFDGRGIKITSMATAADEWDTQFWVKLDRPVASGTKVHIEFNYRASEAASVPSQLHNGNCNYVFWGGLAEFKPSVNWKNFTQDFVVPKDGEKNIFIQSFALSLNKAKDKAIDFYFDNFLVYAEKTDFTVAEAGWGTFSFNDAVHFGSDVEAYAAEYDAGSVKLTAINSLTAGKGAIIKATAGSHYAIVNKTPSFTDADNELLVSDGTAEGDGSTIFALGKKNGVVGFVKVKNGTKIPAGKAYLVIPSTARDFIGFDGETTAIEAVQQNAKADNQYFNLAGQRVAQPTKGLYIVNGKKVIIK